MTMTLILGLFCVYVILSCVTDGVYGREIPIESEDTPIVTKVVPVDKWIPNAVGYVKNLMNGNPISTRDNPTDQPAGEAPKEEVKAEETPPAEGPKPEEKPAAEEPKEEPKPEEKKEEPKPEEKKDEPKPDEKKKLDDDDKNNVSVAIESGENGGLSDLDSEFEEEEEGGDSPSGGFLSTLLGAPLTLLKGAQKALAKTTIKIAPLGHHIFPKKKKNNKRKKGESDEDEEEDSGNEIERNLIDVRVPYGPRVVIPMFKFTTLGNALRGRYRR